MPLQGSNPFLVDPVVDGSEEKQPRSTSVERGCFRCGAPVIRDKVRHLRTAAPPGGAAQARLRGERRLADLDPTRLGFGQTAIVCVQHLRLRGPWPDLRARALRPALEDTAAERAEVVWFQDGAEMLSCLARDAVAGRLERWWWPLLLDERAPSPARIAAAFAADLPSARAALERIRENDLLPPFRAHLGEVRTADLQRAAGTADPGTNLTEIVSVPEGSAEDRRSGAAAPQGWFEGSFGIHTAPDPSKDRDDPTGKAPPLPPSASLRAGEPLSLFAPGLPATRPDPGEGWTDSVNSSAPPSGAFDRLVSRGPDQVPDPAVPPRSIPAVPSASIPPVVSTDADVSPAPSPLSPTPPLEPALPRDHADGIGSREPANIGREEEERPSASASSPRPAATRGLASPDPIAMTTEFGGLLFVLDALLALEWIADFTRPADAATGIAPLAYLLRLGHHRFGRRFAADPLRRWIADLLEPEPVLLPPERLDELEARIALALGCRPRRAIHRLCRRKARIRISSGRLEAEFRLEDHPLEIRLAGLDRDPGWIPSAGWDFRFHFSVGGT